MNETGKIEKQIANEVEHYQVVLKKYNKIKNVLEWTAFCLGGACRNIFQHCGLCFHRGRHSHWCPSWRCPSSLQFGLEWDCRLLLVSPSLNLSSNNWGDYDGRPDIHKVRQIECKQHKEKTYLRICILDTNNMMNWIIPPGISDYPTQDIGASHLGYQIIPPGN